MLVQQPGLTILSMIGEITLLGDSLELDYRHF
jgi:hypothetical protein